MTTPNAFPVFDGHNDSLLHLYASEHRPGGSLLERSSKGHIDLPRARDGGFGGGFFAIFVPSPAPEGGADLPVSQSYHVALPPPLEPSYALRMAMAGTARFFQLEAASQGQFCVVRTHAELSKCLKEGTIAAILHFEGAEAIDPELDALDVFYQAGLRSLGIVWSRPTIFAHGVPFSYPSSPDTGPGLTDAGRALVRRCNELGIMVDLSHLNERGFWDVASITTAPLVATHSNVHAICPVSRNLVDRQLDAIRDSDGMVGLNFAVSFLRPDGKNDADTPLDVMVQHIDYLVERLGIDRVGFGSDFDGALIPQDIGDVAGLPRLLDALRQHGYDDPALRKLTHENWLRVLGKTWRS